MEYRELPHGGEKFGVIGLGTAQLGATQSPFGQALIRYQCLQYALDTPGAASTTPRGYCVALRRATCSRATLSSPTR
ncbi:MAG TPA: hypothetical protein IAA39_07760 [Candidatus Olsenella avistercoris]|nr:hypothetical protein [Candidatus Olsenella avistercoris]